MRVKNKNVNTNKININIGTSCDEKLKRLRKKIKGRRGILRKTPRTQPIIQPSIQPSTSFIQQPRPQFIDSRFNRPGTQTNNNRPQNFSQSNDNQLFGVNQNLAKLNEGMINLLGQNQINLLAKSRPEAGARQNNAPYGYSINRTGTRLSRPTLRARQPTTPTVPPLPRGIQSPLTRSRPTIIPGGQPQEEPSGQGPSLLSLYVSSQRRGTQSRTGSLAPMMDSPGVLVGGYSQNNGGLSQPISRVNYVPPPINEPDINEEKEEENRGMRNENELEKFSGYSSSLGTPESEIESIRSNDRQPQDELSILKERQTHVMPDGSIMEGARHNDERGLGISGQIPATVNPIVDPNALGRRFTFYHNSTPRDFESRRPAEFSTEGVQQQIKNVKSYADNARISGPEAKSQGADTDESVEFLRELKKQTRNQNLEDNRTLERMGMRINDSRKNDGGENVREGLKNIVNEIVDPQTSTQRVNAMISSPPPPPPITSTKSNFDISPPDAEYDPPIENVDSVQDEIERLEENSGGGFGAGAGMFSE